MAELILFSVAVVLVYMTLWCLLAQLLGRNDVADVAWGFGFMVLASALFFRFSESTPKHLLALVMVALWGSRLAIHIAIRALGKPEDGRYQAMRAKWKFPWLQAFLNVFMLQGLLIVIVSLPIILLSLDSDGTLHPINYVGFAIWLFGFIFETVGDLQLRDFLKNRKNKGKIMQTGLWKFTRHPNYFGEITLWWGFYLFTFQAPYWPYGVIGPLTITFLILGISGIPMLEDRYKGNKDYDKYKKRTSSFFPLPPGQ